MDVIKNQLKLDLPLKRKFGGRQEGAGRPRVAARRIIHHIKRDAFASRHPLHVTIRVREDIPKLRTPKFNRAFYQVLAGSASRAGFRVVHYSLQSNHVHCLIEAKDKTTLANGMKSFSARFARAVNRVFNRTGKVLEGRYHVRTLKTPKEVRNALAYVLLNARKHYVQCHGKRPPAKIDPCSSGKFFDGWKGLLQPPPVSTLLPKATTWLLAKGWRKHRLIRLDEVPG